MKFVYRKEFFCEDNLFSLNISIISKWIILMGMVKSFFIIRNPRFAFQKSNEFISPLRRFEGMKQKLWSQFGIDISDREWKKENRRENDKRPVQIQTMLFRIIGRVDQSIDFFIRIGFVFNHATNSFKQLSLVYLKNLSKSLKTQHLV